MGKELNIDKDKLNIDDYQDGDFDSEISKFEGAIVDEMDFTDETNEVNSSESTDTNQPVKKGSRGRPKGCNPSAKYKATIKALEDKVAELNQQLLSCSTTPLITKTPIIPESINTKLSEDLERSNKKILELEASEKAHIKQLELLEKELIALKTSATTENVQVKQEQPPKPKFSNIDKGTIEHSLYKAFVDEGYDISMDQVKDAYRIIMNVLVKLL